ncbi:MAG: flagellar hook-associated protein FlgK [Pirellulaceae bacterium]|nr:flagellar hook-associated protein FlgK [Pirellulaceae bacterium]
MTLFSAIQNSANALQVAALGLHVVGNNVSNAGTPGYIRQELLTTTGPSVRMGSSILTNGVRSVGVKQKVDLLLLDRMREVRSSLEENGRLGQFYSELESMLGELSDNDLSSKINDFSASIQDLMNHPGNEAIRRLVIESGHELASNIRSISRQLSSFGDTLNAETYQVAGEINRLTGQIANLNRRIVELEGGAGAKTSDAAGLRDERIRALDELSIYINIRSVEQESGAVSVFVGGDYLVADGIQREVKSAVRSTGTVAYPEVRLVDTDSPLEVTGGRLYGIYTARALSMERISSQLDDFTRSLIDQFNRIHTQGQGIQGFQRITSANATDDPLGPLDLAGLHGQIQNGAFQIQVTDLETGSVITREIRVSLGAGTNDSSLEDIRSQLSAVSGLTATISSDGRLQIATNSHKLRFTFQNDTSNFLSAVGINTFFVGNSAATIQVNSIVANDPRMLAASLTGVGFGTQNAVRMAQAFDDPVASLGGRSIKESYEEMVVQLAQNVSQQQGKLNGLENFYKTLEAQHLAVSGVNLDEEAVKMIFFQRMFQANSKVIQTSNEILDVLMDL